MRNYYRLIELVDDINNGNRENNATAFDGKVYDNGNRDVEVRINDNCTDSERQERYNRLLVFCLTHGCLILNTHPGTLTTTIRIIEKA